LDRGGGGGESAKKSEGAKNERQDASTPKIPGEKTPSSGTSEK